MLNYTPKGWIKLHRDLERQEVFKDSDTLRVFLYLVCRAVTEPTTYRDVTINRGQLAITFELCSEYQSETFKVNHRGTQNDRLFGSQKGIRKITRIYPYNYL